MQNSGERRDGPSAGDPSVAAEEVNCRRFVELLTDYFERALAPRTLSQVEEHLVMCDWCVTYADQMKSTVASLHALEEARLPEPPQVVLTALRARNSAGR